MLYLQHHIFKCYYSVKGEKNKLHFFSAGQKLIASLIPMTSRDRIKAIRNQPRTMEEKRNLRYGPKAFLLAQISWKPQSSTLVPCWKDKK